MTQRVDPAAAREQAHRILSEKRFRNGPGAPHFLHGFLHWLGKRVQPISNAIGRAFAWVAQLLPGGRTTLWILLACAVLAVAAATAARVGRRRAGRALEAGEGRSGRRRLDPRELERLAEEAERRGDHDRAIRLLFQAGLLRLERAGVVERGETLTVGQVRRRLRSADFDRIARTFEAVAYGGRGVDASAVDEARQTWPAVVHAARA